MTKSEQRVVMAAMRVWRFRGKHTWYVSGQPALDREITSPFDKLDNACSAHARAEVKRRKR